MFGFFLVVVVPMVLWVLFSLKTLRPEEVALMEYFGELDEKKLYGPGGICFVPWFFNQINLITFSTEKHLQTYRKEDGFEARTREKVKDENGKLLANEDRLQPVKVVVDANATFELPWKSPQSLARLLRSKVPVGDSAKIREWVRTAIARDVTELVGKYNYDEVKGSQKSTELTSELRKVIVRLEHLLHRAGFFGDDPSKIEEGSGIFDFNVEFVHLPKNVSEQIDTTETARLSLAAAKTNAQKESVENVGTLMQMLITGGFGSTEKEVQERIAANPELQVKYFELCTKFTLNDQVMTGGGILKKYEGLEGMNDLTRGLLAAAAEFGSGGSTGNQGASQQGGNSGGKNQGGGKKGGNSGSGKPEKFTGDKQGEGESEEDYLKRLSE